MLISGSNLYNKDAGPAHFDGYIGPLEVDNNAAFHVPFEPVDGYDTLLDRQTITYNKTFHTYDAGICHNVCEQATQKGQNASESDIAPYVNGAFPVCSMFVAFELRKEGAPVALICDAYSSVWNNHYQSAREVEGMQVISVAAYQRDDYQFPAICAMKEHCKGDNYYEGGDCSGWGKGMCATSQ